LRRRYFRPSIRFAREGCENASDLQGARESGAVHHFYVVPSCGENRTTRILLGEITKFSSFSEGTKKSKMQSE
jgi:hypothetical protein